MRILENKTEAEKRKIILAFVLGVLALISLIYNFSGILISRNSKPITPKVSTTPPITQTDDSKELKKIANQTETESEWLTTPVSYNPSSFLASEAGRNIFAFYEPPPPTPYQQQTPTPESTPKPTPTPPLIISFLNPQSVYAGTKSFRLEVSGMNFTPETYIFWNGSQLPTIFVSPEKLVADIPATMVSSEGVRQIEIRSVDGKLYSLPAVFTIQAPPRPQFKYIGLIARRSYNNDTAYFQEGDRTPFGARLGDVIGDRFRVISISAKEVVLEDVNLGFRHRLPLTRSTESLQRQSNFVPPGFPPDVVMAPPPVNPSVPSPQQEIIPGIPPNIPRYIPPVQQRRVEREKFEDKSEDKDENDDGNR